MMSRSQRCDKNSPLGFKFIQSICQARQRKKIDKMVEKGVDPSKVQIKLDCYSFILWFEGGGQESTDGGWTSQA